jgi:nicotinate-nucleotide--dimethylbenzimidazole phosphoribosyltransferase
MSRDRTDRTGPGDPAKRLAAALEMIGPLDATAMSAATAHLDRLTKPPGSLGRLEELVVTLAGITGRVDAPVARRAIVIAAADHGIARHAVSAYPSEVTAQMVANFVAGGAAINALAASIDADITVIDVGVAGVIPLVARRPGRGGRLIGARIAAGTADFTLGPALTRHEALAAVVAGMSVVGDLAADGVDLIGIGEMGIGNTTAASAVTAVLTGRPVEAVTGTGTGIDDDRRRRKIATIESALALHRPDPGDPIDVLSAVGGLEIAALVGTIIEAASRRIPVVLDGFITGSAALLAVGLSPAIAARVIAAHRSSEPGHAAILARLARPPLLDLDLRLGEGTGAALAMGLIVASVRIRDEMATFEAAGIAGPATGSVPV